MRHSLGTDKYKFSFGNKQWVYTNFDYFNGYLRPVCSPQCLINILPRLSIFEKFWAEFGQCDMFFSRLGPTEHIHIFSIIFFQNILVLPLKFKNHLKNIKAPNLKLLRIMTLISIHVILTKNYVDITPVHSQLSREDK